MTFTRRSSPSRSRCTSRQPCASMMLTEPRPKNLLSRYCFLCNVVAVGVLAVTIILFVQQSLCDSPKQVLATMLQECR